MIVCHCNVVTRDMVAETVSALTRDEPFRVITAGLVFKALGKRGKCCGCLPVIIDYINELVDTAQAERIEQEKSLPSMSQTAVRMRARRAPRQTAPSLGQQMVAERRMRSTVVMR